MLFYLRVLEINPVTDCKVSEDYDDGETLLFGGEARYKGTAEGDETKCGRSVGMKVDVGGVWG